MIKLDTFIFFYFISNIIIAILFPIILTIEYGDKSRWMCCCFIKWLRKEFDVKNTFGKTLVTIICVYIIPSLCMLIILDFIESLESLIRFIWNLGNKKENK